MESDVHHVWLFDGDLEINVEILSDGWKWLIKSWVVRCSCEVETDYYAIRTKSLRQEINRERGFHWWNHQSLNIALVSNFSCHRRDSSQYLRDDIENTERGLFVGAKIAMFHQMPKKEFHWSGCARIGKILFCQLVPIFSHFWTDFSFGHHPVVECLPSASAAAESPPFGENRLLSRQKPAPEGPFL